MDGFTQLVILVALALLVVGVLALRRLTLARMAMRNISRKKRHTVLVVAGLLIATAMISGSLVVGDTLAYVIRSDTFEVTSGTDIIVAVTDDTGRHAYFNESVAYDLIADLEAGELEYVDGAQPNIELGATVIKPATNATAPMGGLFATDVDHLVSPLRKLDGTSVTRSDISGGLVVINEDMADQLHADVGDQIIVILEDGAVIPFQVSAIAEAYGLGNWLSSEQVFIDLDYAQSFVLSEPGMINSIHISNTGGIEDGYKVTDEAVMELQEFLPPTHEYEFEEIKKDGVENADEVSDGVTQIFIIMSSFAIIAGVALIVNIFVMLAEERKPEMGISRAIGMQRGDLTQSFLFEGIVYALFASAVGSLVGLLIAGLMMVLFSGMVGGGVDFVLHFEWTSLGIAACAGFLITALTVVVSSWRVSKLNIVRAIRDIPEPMLGKSERRYLVWGTAASALGILILIAGIDANEAAGLTAGPTLMAFGLALIGIRFVSPRVLFTVAGAFLIFWELDPFNVKGMLFPDMNSGIEMFIVSGIALVTGGVLIVIFNSDLLLEGLIRIAGKKTSLLPVLRTGMSYPLNKKFRTALSLFIFALIMFTVVVIAMIASFQRESVDSLTVQFSGGFEIIGFSMRDIGAQEFANGTDEINSPSEVIDRYSIATTAPLAILGNETVETRNTMMIGYEDALLEAGGFSLSQRLDEYPSDADAWRAVADDSSLVIMDGSVIESPVGVNFGNYFVDLGEELTLVFQDGTMSNVTVIAMMDQVFLQGVFTSSSFLVDSAPSHNTNLFYISTAEGMDEEDEVIADAVESTFASFGMTTIVVEDTVREFMKTVSSTMQLMEVFLGIGLVVGITGLGIITIRNVAERRQEIGVMRAIGFQKKMILQVFLLETSFVALLGIILGMALGLGISVNIHSWGGFADDAPFVIPWGEILLLVFVAFLITLLSVAPPARSAAKLVPAEALRRVD